MARTKLEIVIPSRDPAGYTRTVWGAIIPPSAPIAQMKKEALSKIKFTDGFRPTKKVRIVEPYLKTKRRTTTSKSASSVPAVQITAKRQPARECRKAKE